MAKWYDKIKDITAPIVSRKSDEGLKVYCPDCKKGWDKEILKAQINVCSCGYHFKINASDYFELLFDDDTFQPLFEEVQPIDLLNFTDVQSYADRLNSVSQKTEISEALSIAKGTINSKAFIVAAMNFDFIAGSMGVVMGERLRLALERGKETKTPVFLIAKSGGARLMESAFALLQMSKITVAIDQYKESNLPFITLLTDPTIGSAATISMLGDIIISEPGALIGYTAPRVVKETMGKNPYKGFQQAEFLLEHGFVDFLVERNQIKEKLTLLASYLID